MVDARLPALVGRMLLGKRNGGGVIPAARRAELYSIGVSRRRAVCHGPGRSLVLVRIGRNVDRMVETFSGASATVRLGMSKRGETDKESFSDPDLEPWATCT